MNRRAILKRLAYSLVLISSHTWTSSAFADDDDDEEDDDNNSGKGGHNDGDDHSNDNDNSGKGSENSGHGNSDDDDNNSNRGPGNNNDDDNNHGHGHDDEDHALEATQSNQAMPLRKIIQNFRREIGGNITEIRLFQRQDILEYRFQYINKDGHVVYVKYDAATGQIIND